MERQGQVELAGTNGKKQLHDATDHHVYYNPSVGIVDDLLESIGQKLSPTSDMGDRVANLLEHTNGKWSDISAYSQGTLILSNAMTRMQIDNQTFCRNPTVEVWGSAANRDALSALAINCGVTNGVGGDDFRGKCHRNERKSAGDNRIHFGASDSG